MFEQESREHPSQFHRCGTHGHIMNCSSLINDTEMAKRQLRTFSNRTSSCRSLACYYGTYGHITGRSGLPSKFEPEKQQVHPCSTVSPGDCPHSHDRRPRGHLTDCSSVIDVSETGKRQSIHVRAPISRRYLAPKAMVDAARSLTVAAPYNDFVAERTNRSM